MTHISVWDSIWFCASHSGHRGEFLIFSKKCWKLTLCVLSDREGCIVCHFDAPRAVAIGYQGYPKELSWLWKSNSLYNLRQNSSRSGLSRTTHVKDSVMQTALIYTMKCDVIKRRENMRGQIDWIMCVRPMQDGSLLALSVYWPRLTFPVFSVLALKRLSEVLPTWGIWRYWCVNSLVVWQIKAALIIFWIYHKYYSMLYVLKWYFVHLAISSMD